MLIRRALAAVTNRAGALRRAMAAAATHAAPRGDAGALFQDQSSLYRAFRPTYPASLYECIESYAAASSCARDRHDLAVDVATGTGQAAVELAQRYAQVIGIDASPAQVAEAPPAQNILFRLGTAENTGLTAACAALVTAAQALHWFVAPDFYAEAARILRPGGTLAVWGYTAATFPQQPEVAALFREFFFGTLGPYWDARRQLLDGGYAGLDPSSNDGFARVARIQGLSISLEWGLADLEGYARTASAYVTFCKAHGGVAVGDPVSDPVAKLVKDVEAAVRGVAQPAVGQGGGAPDARLQRASPVRLHVEWPIILILAQRVT